MMLYRSAPSTQRAVRPAVLSNLIRLLTSMLLVFTGLAVVTPSVAHAATGISLSKTSAGSVLYGGSASFTLTATNPTEALGGVEQYNLSFTDTLPQGLTYVSGSTSPANFGEPQVIRIIDGDNGTPSDTSDDPFHQVLVWPNVSDLTPGASQALTFSAQTDPEIYSIGAKIDNKASAWVSSEPRVVPSFDEEGELEPEDAVTGDRDDATTSVTAVRIEKSEGSAEGELLRGVNDHQTVYSLKVTNNFVGPTEELVVTDYLPAGLEFLGCPGKFNSTTPEYEGAGNTVTVAIPDCLAPISVDTVELKANDPDGNPVKLAPGVYTKVTWNIGKLDADKNRTRTIKYAAGIPQRANTMKWSDEEPTAESGKQAANLENNNGPSTRETSTELGLTNGATVAGKYDGDNVGDDDRASVTAEDLRLLKSVSPSEFVQGQLATYTLDVAVSEYMDASKLSITDVLPPGLCPVQTADPSYTPDAAVAEECRIDQGAAPSNGAITGVSYAMDGTYTLTITPDKTAMDANGHVQITYQARMRANYTIAGNSPTSSLDEFTNEARISGVTDPRKGVDAPDPSGTEEVRDTSSATLHSTAPTLTKLRMPNADQMTCSEDTNAYKDTAELPADEEPFTKGDRACFLLKLDFPHGVDTRNVQLTDFLPNFMVYEGYKAIKGADLTVLMSSGGASATWALGKGTNPRIVPKGSQIYIVVSAIVAKTPPVTAKPKPLAKENLAKLRWTNSAGKSQSLRDAISLPFGPPAPIGILKGVQAINGTTVSGGNSQGGNDSLTYNVVRGSDKVTYRIDVQNTALPGEINAETIASPEVWDVLPVGVKCANLTSSSHAYTCYDAGAPGRPTLNPANTTEALVIWKLPATFTLTAQQYKTITYDLTMPVPADLSVSTVLPNTAAVVSYASATNVPADDPSPVAAEVALHFPEENLSAANVKAVWDVPAAKDVTSVKVPDAKLAKSYTTTLNETGNTDSQATIGETINYVVAITVPAKTTVFNALMTDAMPGNLTPLGTATATLDGGAMPGGFTLDQATGKLTFPATYTNPGAADQVFRVTIPVRVSNVLVANGGPKHGDTLKNTAIFNSTTALTNGSPVTPLTAEASVIVVEPSPTLTKAANPATNVPGGSAVTYTLTAKNAAANSPLHGAVVTDCLPEGLTFEAVTSPAGASVTTTPGTGPLPGGNGCAVNSTKIVWTLSSTLLPGVDQTLSYRARLTSTPSGSMQYTNSATLTGGSLTGSDAAERTYAAPASATVTVQAATFTKTSEQTTLTPGQQGTWSITVSIPKNVAFYNMVVLDNLPTGFSPADVVTTLPLTCVYADATACALPTDAGDAIATSVQNIGWKIGTLATDARDRTITITYKATLLTNGGTRGQARTNTANLRWLQAPGAYPTDASQTTWGVGPAAKTTTITVTEPNVRITKSTSNAVPGPSDQFTYTIRVSNTLAGNAITNLSDAKDVEVTDCLPAGLVFVATTLGSPTATAVPGTTANGCAGGTFITWAKLATLKPGAANDVELKFEAKLDGSDKLTATGKLTNTAKLPSYHNGYGKTYTGANSTVDLTPQFPKVVPSKAVDNAVAYVGEEMGWTITLTNTGTAPAFDAVVTDLLPVNWTYVADSAFVSEGGGQSIPLANPDIVTSNNQQTLTWKTGKGVPSTGIKTLVIKFKAKPTGEALTSPGTGAAPTNPHTNTVSAVVKDGAGYTGNATTGQSVPGNPTTGYASGTATAATYIHRADLVIDKTSNAQSNLITAGTDLVWTIKATNSGPNPAVGPIVVTDTLPSADVFSSIVIDSAPNWTCSLDPIARTLSCTRPGPLASGASAEDIKIRARVRANADADVTLTNTAKVSAKTYDPNLSNNEDSVTDTTRRVVDIAIDKSVNTDPVVAGQNVAYSLNVTNNGQSDGRNGEFVVVDPIPAGTTFVSATSVGNAWNCGFASGSVTCRNTATLTVGAKLPTITVTVAVPSGVTAKVDNSATVTGPEHDLDPNKANNTDTTSSTVTTRADLGLTKAHSLGENDWVAGGTGEYTFTVSNYGPSDAAAPKVVDTLPAMLTYDSVTAGGGHWSCTVGAGNQLTCVRDAAMAAGTSGSPVTETFKILVKIASDHVGNIHNEATVSATTTDPNLGNNVATDDTATTQRADLGIDKDGPTTALAGNEVTFTLKVTNHGESDSPAPSATVDPITVTDTLPAGMSFVSASGTNWNCSASGQVVTCKLGTGLVSGASTNITLKAAIGAGVEPQTLRNSANVTGPLPDQGPNPNTDNHDVAVGALADLKIAKSVTPQTAHAGTKVTYTITVHNDGPSVARDVLVVDPLLTGLTLDKITAPSGWTCAEGLTVSCEAASLAPGTGNDVTITVTATIGSGVPAGTNLVNTARVSSPTDPSDSSDDATVHVTARADLTLVKSHDESKDPVLAGRAVTFTLKAHNSGPSDALAPVTIVDTLPPGLSYAGSTGSWDCVAAAATASGQVVTCVLQPTGTTLLAGADAPPLTLTAQVASDLASTVTELTNTAAVSSSTPGDKGTDTDTVPVRFDADLSVVKSHTGNGRIGDQLSFTLEVANDGPSTARNVVVTDDLPDGLEYVSATGGTDWNCSQASGKVSCGLNGTLAPGETVEDITVTVVVRRAAWPSVTNTAVIGSDTPDSNTTNNESDDPVTILDAANVTITKTADPMSVVAGELVTYTLTATNEGPAAAVNVVVDDTLPSDLTFVSITTPAGWTCNNASPIKCEIPSLAANASGVITIKGRVGVSVPTGSTISNIARIATSTDGDNPLDNSSQVTVAVTTSADLKLAKVASTGAEDWIAGGYGEYTLTVANLGPSDALAPRVVDQLPASVTYVGLIDDGAGHWSCVLGTGNKLTCDRDAAMAAGTPTTPVMESFRIKVLVAAGHTGGITNSAVVSSNTPDPDLENNDATVTTGTSARADLGIVKDGDASVLAGNSAHFTLTVRNYGESDSPAPGPGVAPITVVDTLPTGMTYVSASGGTDWDCSVSGQKITCELQTALKAGATAPAINVVADVATSIIDDSLLKNTATVAGPLPEPPTGKPNTDDHEVLVSTLAALKIVKVADAETVLAGEEVTYTLTVTNNGPSDALDVQVSDPLLSELTLVSATVTAAGWTCQATAPVSCTGGRLEPGAANAVEITVVAKVASSVADGTELVNVATVHSPTDPSDSTDDETVVVDTLADLTLTKTHDAARDPILAGDEVEFTLVAHNAGPSDALPTLTIVDTLPVGMSYVSASGWTCAADAVTAAGQVVTCTLPETVLVAGTDATPLRLKVLVDPALDPQVTSLTNNAEVTSGTPGEPGTASDVVPVGYRADLAITKVHDQASVRVGDITDFTLQVSNAGPSAAHRVVVTDTLPAGLEFVSVAGAAAESAWTCTEAVGLIECDLTGVLAPGAAAEPIVVRARVLATAYPKVTNVAGVASTTPDGNLENNEATDEVVVPPQVDLGITKTHAPEPLQVGQQGTYTLTVTNTGNTADPGPITVTDTLPTGLAYVSGSGEGWTCAASGQDVSCVLASGLKTGGTATITLVVDVLPAAYPAVTNVAKVSSAAEDLKPENNQATDPATVLPLYSLSIGKELASQTAGRATWTITVNNAGPNPAPDGVTIVDNLPGMLSYASYSGEGWTCTVAGQVVTCDHPAPIAAGESAALTLVTTIDSGFSGTVVNSAGIVGGDSDEAEAEVPDANEDLAFTGGAAIGAGLLGVGLLAGGALLLVVRRRRLS